MTRSGLGPDLIGQRLRISAVGHLERTQHCFAPDLRIGLLFDVHYRELRDCYSASRVPELRAGFKVNAHRRRIGRGSAVEDLRQGWNSLARCITRKYVNGQSSRVTQEVRQRHLFPRGEFVVREFPRNQLVIDILFERDLALGNLLERDHGRNRLAYRTGLKQRVRSGGVLSFDVLNSVCLRPFVLEVVHHLYADGRLLVLLYPVLNGPTGMAFDQHRGQESVLDVPYASFKGDGRGLLDRFVSSLRRRLAGCDLREQKNREKRVEEP